MTTPKNWHKLTPEQKAAVEDYILILLGEDDPVPADVAPVGNGTKPRKRTQSHKTGTYVETRTIRNRSGIGGKSYQWRYEVTYEDGKRVKSTSLGRVK